MKKKIIIILSIIAVLIGSNCLTWKAKTFIDNYNLHPIERSFNKLPKQIRLFVMLITLQEISKGEKAKQVEI